MTTTMNYYAMLHMGIILLIVCTCETRFHKICWWYFILTMYENGTHTTYTLYKWKVANCRNVIIVHQNDVLNFAPLRDLCIEDMQSCIHLLPYSMNAWLYCCEIFIERSAIMFVYTIYCLKCINQLLAILYFAAAFSYVIFFLVHFLTKQSVPCQQVDFPS